MHYLILFLSIIISSPAWAIVNVERYPTGTSVQACQPNDTGTGCTGVAGGSNIGIGTAIPGGVPDAVLYLNSSNQLSASSSLIYSNATPTLTLSGIMDAYALSATPPGGTTFLANSYGAGIVDPGTSTLIGLNSNGTGYQGDNIDLNASDGSAYFVNDTIQINSNGSFITPGINDTMQSSGDSGFGDYNGNYNGVYLDINSNANTATMHGGRWFSDNGFFITQSNLGGVLGGFIPDYDSLPIIDTGMNVPQFGSIDSLHEGVMYRTDVRNPAAGQGGPYPVFQLITSPIGDYNAADQLAPLRVTNPNSSSIVESSVMIDYPDNGSNNTGTGNSEALMVYGNSYLGGNVGINTSVPSNGALIVMGGNVGIGTILPTGTLTVKHCTGLPYLEGGVLGTCTLITLAGACSGTFTAC